jgi:hypothetical protein
LDEAAKLREAVEHGAVRMASTLLYGESILAVQVTWNEQLAKRGESATFADERFGADTESEYTPVGSFT